jgi:hypothetical protein
MYWHISDVWKMPNLEHVEKNRPTMMISMIHIHSAGRFDRKPWNASNAMNAACRWRSAVKRCRSRRRSKCKPIRWSVSWWKRHQIYDLSRCLWMSMISCNLWLLMSWHVLIGCIMLCGPMSFRHSSSHFYACWLLAEVNRWKTCSWLCRRSWMSWRLTETGHNYESKPCKRIAPLLQRDLSCLENRLLDSWLALKCYERLWLNYVELMSLPFIYIQVHTTIYFLQTDNDTHV